MSDLTAQEQDNVRAALRFLHTRCGNWEVLAKVLRFGYSTIANAMGGFTVTASLAVRVARMAGVSVDDVLTGKYPPAGTCPHCGHRPESPTTEADR